MITPLFSPCLALRTLGCVRSHFVSYLSSSATQPVSSPFFGLGGCTRPIWLSHVQYTQTDTVRNYKFTIRTVWKIVKKIFFGPYTIGKLYLISESSIYITCYLSEGVTTVCRFLRFVRFFRIRSVKCIKTFEAKENINQGILPQQWRRARHILLARSLSVSDHMASSKRKKISIEGWCHNKRARYACIHRYLSVSDNMACSKRKRISTEL